MRVQGLTLHLGGHLLCMEYIKSTKTVWKLVIYSRLLF